MAWPLDEAIDARTPGPLAPAGRGATPIACLVLLAAMCQFAGTALAQGWHRAGPPALRGDPVRAFHPGFPPAPAYVVIRPAPLLRPAPLPPPVFVAPAVAPPPIVVAPPPVAEFREVPPGAALAGQPVLVPHPPVDPAERWRARQEFRQQLRQQFGPDHEPMHGERQHLSPEDRQALRRALRENAQEYRGRPH